jgi:hypothetical protein
LKHGEVRKQKSSRQWEGSNVDPEKVYHQQLEGRQEGQRSHRPKGPKGEKGCVAAENDEFGRHE